MRGLLLAALVVAAGCAPQGIGGLAEPLVVSRVPATHVCDAGLAVVGRIEVGGVYESVAADAHWLYASTQSGVQVFPRASGAPAPIVVIPTRGEANAVLSVDGRLWVADGTGGIARLEGLEDPASASRVEWSVGGNIVALAAGPRTIWAADTTGRVLALPLDASADTVPRSVEVDGKPVSLAHWEGVVVVAALAGGLLEISDADGVLSVGPGRHELAHASRVASGGGVLYAARGQTLTRWTAGGARTTVQLDKQVLGILPREDGVLVAAQSAGLFSWVGGVGEPVRWADDVLVGRAGLSAEGLVGIDERTVLVAGGLLGPVRATWDGSGWTASEVLREGGDITSLDAIPGGVLAGFVMWNDAGRLVRIEAGDAGGYTHVDGVDAGGWPSQVVPIGEELFVARRGEGLGVLDAAQPLSGQVVRPVALEGSTITGLAKTVSDGLVAVAMDRSLHWLDRSADGGWSEVGTGGLSKAPAPTDVQVDDSGARITTGYVGTLYRWAGPDVVPVAKRALVGPAGATVGVQRLTRSLSDPEHLWIPIPSVGLERYRKASGESTVVPFLPGGWAATAWGDELVVARGTGGVALVSEPLGRQPELGPSCDLPADARRLLVHDGRLLVGASGTIFVLERRP